MIKLYKLRDYDFRLVIALIILSFIGVLLVGSAEASLQNRQLMGMILGLIVMVVVSLIDFSWILNFSWVIYFLNIKENQITYNLKNCDHYILRTFFYGA